MYEVIITKYKDGLLYALKDENRFLRIIPYNRTAADSRIGRIINGLVEKKADNISSSFLRLSKDESGFLDGADLKPGTVIPVQVVKEAKNEKKCKVTKKLSVPGRYVVVIMKESKGLGDPGEKGLNGHSYVDEDEAFTLRFSKKFSKEQKEKLTEDLLRVLKGFRAPYELIVRTNAMNVPPEALAEETKKLSKIMDDILSFNDKRPAFSLLYEPEDELIRELMDIELNRLGSIITDSKEEYELIEDRFYRDIPAEIRDGIKFGLYSDDLVSLFRLKGIGAGISLASSKKVWLKNGAYIVIEETEALTVIDVNSGNSVGRGIKEETVLAINKDAAEEILNQLVLRNISGIIIVDFINMQKKESIDELSGFIRHEIKKDGGMTVYHDITKLGLVELTRKREGKSLSELI